MYEAAPMQMDHDEHGNIIPRVSLLWMTPDPLGAIAAMCRMYTGVPTYSLADVSVEDRERYLTQVQQTHLQAPLEAVELHFFIEGVTRSFTHQMVRQRTAVYAQESLRFAVKDEAFRDITSLPPSLAGTVHDPEAPESLASTNQQQRWRDAWDQCVDQIDETYHYLVNDGMPAEDARGLVHHAITTRLNYKTNLRNLKEHAGNRLCTQAQFEWRIVFMSIVDAIRKYGEGTEDEWQFTALAESELFRPVCYQLGHCPFNADFDRDCTIRPRVELNAKAGRSSVDWHRRGYASAVGEIEAIHPAEWMLDPAAARNTSGGGGHS
jgi:flavin-dependent thymidylate synthase